MMNLTKTAIPTGLTGFTFGVGWDVSGGTSKSFIGKLKAARGVDLDASVIATDAGGQPLNCAFFNNTRPFSGALNHTGDNRTGRGDGPDESIVVDLTRMPDDVVHLACVLGSYKGVDFTKVNNIECDILDPTGAQITKILVPIIPGNNAAVIAPVSRTGAEWIVSRPRLFDVVPADVVRTQSWHSLVPLVEKAIRQVAAQ